MMYKNKYIILSFTFACLFLLQKTNCWSREYSPNVHWVFCIDTSGSMKEKNQIDLLKLITEKVTDEFLNLDKQIIKTGDRVTVFSFDQKARLEATSLYQTEEDLASIKQKLEQLNRRRGNLTFISEAIVQAISFVDKYDQFFHTNALYVFTDGKSEPYSPKWPQSKIKIRKMKDAKNFQRISLAGKDHGLNIWMGVLKWEAFEDARSLVNRMGNGGHIVDLTNFNRLSLEKALNDFAQTVRTTVKLPDMRRLDLGTIPYKGSISYQKDILFDIQTDRINGLPSITSSMNFEPDNPSEIKDNKPVKVKTSEGKMFLSFEMVNVNKLKPGTYRGKLKLFPSEVDYGTLIIEPSNFDVEFSKSGVIGYYVWKLLIALVASLTFVFYLTKKVKRKIPIKV